MKRFKMLTVAGLMASPIAMSAGFMLNEQSVSDLGRGNAGRGVNADNAASLAFNPAVSALLEGQNISATFHYIDPNINVKGTQITPAGPRDASADDVAPSAFVPGFYYSMQFNEMISFGVSANSYFGLSTDYPSNYAGSEFANKTGIETMYLTPSIGVRINEQFSVGLGLSYIYGSGEIKNTAPFPVPSIGLNTGDTLLDIDGNGSAFGWTIGGIYEFNEDHRIGLSYRSAVDLEADVDVVALGRVAPGTKAKGTLTFNLPDTAELSYFGQITDTVSLSLGLQYIGWSSFKNLTVDIDRADNVVAPGKYLFKEENWQDSFRYAIGADYQLNDRVTLRAGYSYDESPVKDEYRTLTIPDANRNWLTIGSTIDFEEAGIIDLAFAYIKGDKVDVNESSTLGTVFNGELNKVDAFVFSIGYNYNF